MPSFLSLCHRLCEIKQRLEGIWVGTPQATRSCPGAKVKVATLILIHTGASDHFCRKNPWTDMLEAPLKTWFWLIHVCLLASVPP